MFRAARDSDPLNYEIYGDLCESYAFTGKFPEAIEYADEAIHIDPYNPVCYEIKTFTHLFKGDVKKAEEVVKECESRGVLQEMFDLVVYFTPVSLAAYNEDTQEALDYISHTGWEGRSLQCNINLEVFSRLSFIDG